jgi:aspartate racemase
MMGATKCVGILGGYGPLATAHFFDQVIRATPAERDWEHLHIIVNNNPKVPSRARAFLYGEEDPTARMLEEIKTLRRAGADFFVCPCNSAHHYLRQQPTLPLPFVDMVEVTIDALKSSGYKRALLLGSEVTMQGGMYTDLGRSRGVCVEPYPSTQRLRAIIEAGKTGRGMPEAQESMRGILEDAYRQRYDTVILGCTELPLVLKQHCPRVSVLDTSQILAEETVRYAFSRTSNSTER